MGASLTQPVKSKYAFNMKNLATYEQELLSFSGLSEDWFVNLNVQIGTHND